MALSFRIGSNTLVEPTIRRLILAGFAGRLAKDVRAHIEEMARQGVRPPSVVPSLWPVMPHLVTQDLTIEVFGNDTVPEVEFVLFTWDRVTYVTVGNDQCDIAVERDLGAEKSKNLCQKVVSREAWRLDDVLGHWDDLTLRLACNGTLMQRGRLSGLLRPEVLLEKVAKLSGADNEGRMVFSGTIGTDGAYPAAPYRVDMSLSDPVTGRSIDHSFIVGIVLPLQ